MRKTILIIASLAVVLMAGACKEKDKGPKQVVIATLDPGHFHAALVQKTSYPQVSKDVYVYSNPGADLQEHLFRLSLEPDCPHAALSEAVPALVAVVHVDNVCFRI